MNELHLYNTQSRSIESFSPYMPGVARIYSCGPTVYSRQHLGNLRPYVFADLLKRTLRLHGYRVEHVINITDVGHLTDDADYGNDKMEQAAKVAGASALEVAKIWTELFQRDLALVGVESPNIWAKATEHIAEQITMIERLEEKGFTYRAPDGIYFDTAKDGHYGELSGLSANAQYGRVDASNTKRSPADFALWKFSPTTGPRRQLEWPSPWGVGFPGWHIECSAMATKYLGPHIDIHTGGIDHVAVHHTNEIAQSENALGVRPWVRYWMHGAWLLLDGAKLSKSRCATGKPPNLDDLAVLGVSPAGFRYYLYTAHYRSPIELSDEALRGAEAALRRLRTMVRAGVAEGTENTSPVAQTSEHLERLRSEFHAALADDLNAPRALAVLWEIASQRSIPLAQRGALIGELAASIGLELEERQTSLGGVDLQIEALVRRREDARRARDFGLADSLRAELAANGVLVEDTPEGPKWRRR